MTARLGAGEHPHNPRQQHDRQNGQGAEEPEAQKYAEEGRCHLSFIIDTGLVCQTSFGGEGSAAGAGESPAQSAPAGTAYNQPMGPRVLVLLLPGLIVAGDALAACRASASGNYSFDTRLKPGPARVCRMTVEVFEGRSCGPSPRWQAVLPCDQTERMAISDRGRLISILAPVAKRRDLNAVRVTWKPDRWGWVTLAKLEGERPLEGPVRLAFEGDALRLAADRTVLIPLEVVRQMASALPD